MCFYLSSEAILANLLAYCPTAQYGIEYRDIEQYCIKIKERLTEIYPTEYKYILFQTNAVSFERSLNVYAKQFYKLMGRFYAKTKVNVNGFSICLSSEMCDILKQVAQDM